ncbi:MAG: hypothetical protein KC492_14390, partial [Myxococcales bacterium]|nr:hypothetical protein [Myxococcales bacterium]
ASVDLPAETFLPQVSVQASCVFVRRRAPSELRMVGAEGPKQRPVFMAIAEDCGHGRRGEPRYMREPDGSESLFEIEVPDRWERDGEIQERVRTRKGKRLADDLPLIAEEYRQFVAEGRFS